MSYLAATPYVFVSASDLAGIGSTLNSAYAAAAQQITAVLAAADDEVSTAIAALFSAHGQHFQALSTQAAAFHTGFVQTLSAAAGAYASAEALGSIALHTLSPIDNLSISAFGRTLYQTPGGSSTSSADGEAVAVAYGAHSSATAEGRAGFAVAIGPDSEANANGFGGNVAAAIGSHSEADASLGVGNVAVAGPGSEAHAGDGDANVAVAFGDNNYADAGFHGNGNVACVFGGERNTAEAGGAPRAFGGESLIGNRDIAIFDGSGRSDLLLPVVGNDQTTIDLLTDQPQPSVAVSVDGRTFELGSAHASSSGISAVAVALGDNSVAAADGNRGNVAVAIGNDDSAYIPYGPGTDPLAGRNFAVAFGTDNTAVVKATGSGNVAGVIDGTQNSVIVEGGTGNIALILTGHHLDTNIRGGTGVIDIQPKL